MKILQNKQFGLSLITAIFLLVVISALAAFSVTLFTTQQRSAALDVLGERAYQASRAGLEWGSYQVLQNASAGIFCASPLPASAVNIVTMPAATTLQDFTVTVSCGKTAASEAGATVTLYQLTSTATQGTATTPNYLERQMQVTIAN